MTTEDMKSMRKKCLEEQNDTRKWVPASAKEWQQELEEAAGGSWRGIRNSSSKNIKTERRKNDDGKMKV